MERSEARQRREQQKNLIEENRRLAKEQAAKLNYLDHEGINLILSGNESRDSSKVLWALYSSEA